MDRASGPWLPSGSEAGVDAERLSFRRGRADLLHQLRRDVLGVVEVARALAVVHEHHVDVGGVRELGPAEPAHADDGERHR